jgi:hypothetical protein
MIEADKSLTAKGTKKEQRAQRFNITEGKDINHIGT